MSHNSSSLESQIPCGTAHLIVTRSCDSAERRHISALVSTKAAARVPNTRRAPSCEVTARIPTRSYRGLLLHSAAKCGRNVPLIDVRLCAIDPAPASNWACWEAFAALSTKVLPPHWQKGIAHSRPKLQSGRSMCILPRDYCHPNEPRPHCEATTRKQIGRSHNGQRRSEKGEALGRTGEENKLVSVLFSYPKLFMPVLVAWPTRFPLK